MAEANSGRQPVRIWVIDRQVDDATLERLGDARQVADRLRSAVGVLLVPSGSPGAGVDRLIAHGADRVYCAVPAPGRSCGVLALVAAAAQVLAPHRPSLVFAAGNPHGREWAARLAVALGWMLISPVLLVRARDGALEATGLDPSGGRARRVRINEGDTAVLTLQPGVGEALPADEARRGEVDTLTIETHEEPVEIERSLPADPETVDIQFANRLVAGGRGLGSKDGFDLLRRFAAKIGAGVAASRLAVDLGWIEHARQVGQTGKTVVPDLYIACGISGASHHLEGMSGARHIVAINTDPEAPLLKVAHLGLVADLYGVLEHAEGVLDA